MSDRLAALLGLALLVAPRAAQRAWMFGPFEKPVAVNPIITPNPTSQFRPSMSDSAVHWEGYATFNPAAVVKDGKVYLLYRAEDATGEMRIGGHTSRLGLAESRDGLRFTRRASPVRCARSSKYAASDGCSESVRASPAESPSSPT